MINKILTAFVVVISSLPYAHALSVPTECMNCKLTVDGGAGSGTCVTQCKDCCEPECVDFNKECGGGTVTPDSCQAGKYGTLLCRDCPPDDVTHASVTSASGFNTKITQCYIPMNSSFWDDSGSGVYSGDCNYSM